MNEESSYFSFNMTMPVETKWQPFFKMDATDFCLSFVQVAKHVRILPQVAKYIFFMDTFNMLIILATLDTALSL